MLFEEIDRITIENVKTGEVLAVITPEEISAAQNIAVWLRPKQPDD